MISPTANKAVIAGEVNRIGKIVDALLAYALSGDEEALSAAVVPVNSTPIEVEKPRAPITVESQVVAMPGPAHCPHCNSSAPGHQMGGPACISHDEAIAATNGEMTLKEQLEASLELPEYLPMPENLGPSTDEDYGDEETA